MSLISLSQSGTLSATATAAHPHPAAAALRQAAWTAITLWHAAGYIAKALRGPRSVPWLDDADDAVLRDLGIARSDVARLAKMGRR